MSNRAKFIGFLASFTVFVTILQLLTGVAIDLIFNPSPYIISGLGFYHNDIISSAVAIIIVTIILMYIFLIAFIAGISKRPEIVSRKSLRSFGSLTIFIMVFVSSLYAMFAISSVIKEGVQSTALIVKFISSLVLFGPGFLFLTTFDHRKKSLFVKSLPFLIYYIVLSVLVLLFIFLKTQQAPKVNYMQTLYTPIPTPYVYKEPFACKTLNTHMITDPDGFGYIGCDMEVTSGQNSFDLSRGYCEGQTTHEKEFLVRDAYGRRDRYWTTLTNLDPREVVKVFAYSFSGEKIECLPSLNK